MGVVGDLERLAEIAEPVERQDGTEDLLVVDGAAARYVDEDGRIIESAAPGPAGQNPGAIGHGPGDLVFDPPGCRLGNEWTHIGVVRGGVAEPQ